MSSERETVVRSLVQAGYNAVRHRLPRKLGCYNGVAVRYPRLFDETDIKPDYESELISAIETAIRDGDHIRIIGGGLGVSTVRTARAASNLSIDVYEASPVRTDHIEQTLALNGVHATVHHALVGDAIVVGPQYNQHNVGEAAVIEPTELESCDLLVMDCEGAEGRILSEMEIRPDRIVVETHGKYGSPTDSVRSTLQEIGYRVENVRTLSVPADIMVIRAQADHHKDSP